MDVNDTANREQTDSPRITRIRLVRLSGGDPILASRRKGEAMRASLEMQAGVAPVVVLDFEDADVVTPSFFLGAAWPLWERAHIEQCPLVANLPERSLDDVEIVAKLKNNPVWTGRFGGRFFEPLLLGRSEMAEQDLGLLELMFDRGAVAAADLAEILGGMGVTGWNNRLSALWQKKVLSRHKVGRTYVYRVPWKRSDDVDR